MQKEEIKKQLERLLKPFRIPFRRDGEPLTEEQKRRRARFVVYPLMGLLCLGSLYLIFSPSKEEETRQNRGKGFNTEIPSPEDKELEGNKKDAYEKALLEQERPKRKPSLIRPNPCSGTNSRRTVSVCRIPFPRNRMQTRKGWKGLPERSLPPPEHTGR